MASPKSPYGCLNLLRDDEQAMEEEMEQLHNVMRTMKSFGDYSKSVIGEQWTICETLKEKYGPVIDDHLSDLKFLDHCSEANAVFFDSVARNAGQVYENYRIESIDETRSASRAVNAYFSRCVVTLKQIARDWSEIGQIERQQSYSKIIEALKSRFERPSKDIRVLCPGCGLGRLPFEIALEGFHCQGNECSAFMILTSAFIIKISPDPESVIVYPWLLSFTNNKSIATQTCPVNFPDVSIEQSLVECAGSMEMVSGQFTEVYQESGVWDCVATCFFIDTAQNILEYVDRIHDILKPNGYWINIGPLLYHFSGDPNETSVDLPYDRLRQYIVSKGFAFEDEQTNVHTDYLAKPDSLDINAYKSVFFVCKKTI